jgi:hypothetical protein
VTVGEHGSPKRMQQASQCSPLRSSMGGEVQLGANGEAAKKSTSRTRPIGSPVSIPTRIASGDSR